MIGPARYVSWAVLLVSLATAAESRSETAPPLFINEFMASNGSIADLQGEYDDWIEIYNAGSEPVDMAGMYLSDDRSAPTKWRIPLNEPAETTIAAGDYLLIWADGDTADTGLHTPFELSSDGEQIVLTDTDGLTPIDSVTFPEQVNDVSYGRSPETGRWLFMHFPTPGLPNLGGAYEGVVARVEFSPTRGFCGAPFDVALACGTPGATIYYTLDGSDPAAGSSTRMAYAGAIDVAQTTCLRAVAVKTNWLPGRSITHTYIFPSDVITQPANPAGFPSRWGSTTADYRMDPAILGEARYCDLIGQALGSIPSMSIVMKTDDLFGPDGIYANPTQSGDAWERPASVEWIDPNGAAGFQINCGVRIQGGYFRSPGATSKHSFRLLFKGRYGPAKLKYPLFGRDAVQEFDTIVLRGGANDAYSWGGNEANAQYTKDQFIRDLQRDTGHASPHGRFIHLYVNGLYWGLYNPCERPDGAFSSSYYGGEKDDWDVFKHKSFTLDQGDRTALNLMLSQCQQAAQSYEALLRLQGRAPDGTISPDYLCLLDLTNYVDYLIVNMWAGNWDWPWNNYWLARDRTAASTGFKFYCWDAEDVMLSSRSPLSIDRITSPDTRDVGQLHGQLRNNPEYRLFFADRIHRLLFNGGTLTPDSLIKRYTDLAHSIENAVILEAARWADQHGSKVTPDNWASMRDRILTSYLPQRTAIVLDQFRNAGLYPDVDAPVFHVNGVYQHGGHVLSSDDLTMHADGTIFYTLDGSDPRIGAQTTATGGGPETLVAENTPKRVLVPTGPVGDAWRGGQPFDDSTWTLVMGDPGGVGYERSSGYEPYITLNVAGLMYGMQTSCCLRIPFAIRRDIGQSEVIRLGVRCDDGFVAWINGTEVARSNFTGEPQWNSAAGTQSSDSDAVQLRDFLLPDAATLFQRGQNILAVQAMNISTTSSDLLISVALVTGPGASGSPSPAAAEYAGPITLNHSVCVKARTLSVDQWSALNEAVFAVGPVAEGLRISEIMYHPAEPGSPDDPNAEYIELTNVAGESINLNFVRFTAGVDFTFPDFDLAPGDYCLVVKDIEAFEARYGPGLPVVGRYAGSLSNAGERIELRDAVGTVIHDFRFEDDWFDSTDGMGFSLTLKEPQSADPNRLGDEDLWRPSSQIGGSPGAADSGEPPATQL